jgi:Protein of unknown function (DUF1360)
MPSQVTQGTVEAGAATNGAGRHPRERAGSYGLVMGAYAALTGAYLAWRHASGKGLPERFGAGDLAAIGVATHKTSRLIAKDKVATPIRAPFTEVQGDGGPAEVSEEPAGTGLRRTIGELVACPYCLDMWVATGYAAGLVSAPRTTRFLAAVLSTVAIADFLQMAYRAGQEHV